MYAPPKLVLRLPAGTVALFFFPLATAFLNSFKKAGDCWTLDRALSKASSSWLSMTLRQAPLHRLSLLSTADKPDRAYKRATHSRTRTPQSTETSYSNIKSSQMSCKASRPNLKATKHPIQWAPEVPSSMEKWVEPNADHTQWRMGTKGVLKASPIYILMAWKDNFTLCYNGFPLQINYTEHHHCLLYI